MKKIVLVTALATLAACSKPDAEPAGEATDQVTASAAPRAETVAADGKSSSGTFKVTTADGKVYIEQDKPDGTYVETLDGKVTETGRWEQKSLELFCKITDEAEAKELCSVEKVDAKGIWTSRSPEGKIARVERVAG